MNQRIILIAGLLLSFSSLAHAQTIVAPNTNTLTPGNTDNRFPFLVSGGMRYQQVYSASEFASLTGPTLITQIALRPSHSFSQAFTTTLPDIQIDLSTVNVGPDSLSPIFTDNVGANDSVVYGRGALTLSSSNTPGLFDTVINFTTPFLYDPSAGNLLLDVRNFGGAPSFVGTEYFDAQDTRGDGVSRIFGAEGAPGNGSGTADSFGLITQFQFRSAQAVPEPGATAQFIGLGITGSMFLLRRRRK